MMLKRNRLIAILTVLSLLLSACGVSTLQDVELNSELETNPFAQDNQDSSVSLGGFGYKILDENDDVVIGNREMSYRGEPLEFKYKIHGRKDATGIGFMFFLDGILQPHYIIETTSASEISDWSEPVNLSKHILGAPEEDVFITLAFEPVTGKKGDVLYLDVLAMFEPDYMPENDDGQFGIYHDIKPVTAKVTFFEDGGSGNETVLNAESDYALLDSETKQNMEKNKQTFPTFETYIEGQRFSANVKTEDNQLEITVSALALLEGDYMIRFFMNHEPLLIEGHDKALVHVKGGQVTATTFSFNISNSNRNNAFYFFMTPMGDPEMSQDGFLWRYIHKSSTIHVVNEKKAMIDPNTDEAINKNADAELVSTSEAFDLDSLLKDNITATGFSPKILHANAQEMVLFSDELYRFDLQKMALTAKTDSLARFVMSTSKQFEKERITNYFVLNESYAFLREVGSLNERSIEPFIDIYSEDFQLVKSINLLDVFPGISRSPFLSCTISEDAKWLACPSEKNEILIANTDMQKVDLVFDFRDKNIQNNNIVSLLFFQDNSHLSFVLDTIPEGYACGVVDLGTKSLSFFRYWNTVDDLIQQTASHVYFREEKRGDHSGWFALDNIVVMLDKQTMEVRELKFNIPEETGGFIVQPDGERYATVVPLWGDDDDSNRMHIRVYDNNLNFLIQYEIPYAYPSLYFLEENLLCINTDGKHLYPYLLKVE